MAKKKLDKGRKNIYPDDIDSILQEVGKLLGDNYLFTLTCLDINRASRYCGRYAFATNFPPAEENLEIAVKLTEVQIQKIAERWNVDVEDLRFQNRKR
ncbi:MAG: hypothetical protein IJS81_05925 [Selenomonadaceae bacterium]|nr:hypothetical protein [Selenomonadaceae bacterium]